MGDDIILLTFVNVLVTKTGYLFGATYIKKIKKQENNQCLMRCYLSLCKHLADTCTNVYIYTSKMHLLTLTFYLGGNESSIKTAY